MLNICHVISSIDVSTGGPARSSTHLIDALLFKFDDIKVKLLTKPTSNPIIVNFSYPNGELIFDQNNKRIEYLKSDLYHGHGIWDPMIYNMSKNARKNKVPYVISIRGMLEPWALGQKRFKKRVALKLYQLKDLKNAVCLHATANSELISIRNQGIKVPVAVIPNGINLDKFPEQLPIKCQKDKKILFLSRIHKKKGLELLIEAWGLLSLSVKKDWTVDIIGNGDLSYINELKSIINKKGLNDQIFIYPPVFGDAKVELYRTANLFVLPSYSENFGIVIAEALASYTPVITTKGTPWEDLEIFNCGKWIDPNIDSLKLTLETMLNKNEKELIEMGKNGRKLIESKYSMKSVAEKMFDLYKWILNKENKPPFIDIQ